MTRKPEPLFDLSHTLSSELLRSCNHPWEALPHIKDFVESLGKTLSPEEYDSPAKNIWISKTAIVAPSAVILPPTVIGHNTQIRTGAFLRGAVLVGENCVVGNACELKNAILFDGVQVPHFNYVGDSILGYRAHMGAGAITSNVKCDKGLICVHSENGRVQTGLKKFGAILGDHAEIGCNCVLNPGTVIGQSTTVYPLSSVRGWIPAHCIYKEKDCIVPKKPL